ncbi:hypothetical protein ACW4YW_07605 [Methylobacillus pratensis]
MDAVPAESATPVAARRKKTKPAPIRPDWVSKTLAGLLLGLALTLALSGLLAAMLSDLPMSVKGQLVMWSLPPVWLGVQAGVYFFASGLRAWLWLGGANLLAWGALWLLRLAQQGGAA